MTSLPACVPEGVLEAFGLPEQGRALPGGEGRSFLHGGAVLKPVDDVGEAGWSADLLSAVDQRGFRLPRPLRARDRQWVVEGWVASECIAGETGPAGRWAELFDAGRQFHAALASVPRPAFLDARTHRWAVADRVAWGERAAEIPSEAADSFTRLERVLRPVSAPSQLIHGDLSGNVLFAKNAAPAIIDFSPYWRPVSYADAIVVIDGLVWFGADRDLVTYGAQHPDFPQMLVRALLFRLVALTERDRETNPSFLRELQLFTPVVRIVEQLATPHARSER